MEWVVFGVGLVALVLFVYAVVKSERAGERIKMAQSEIDNARAIADAILPVFTTIKHVNLDGEVAIKRLSDMWRKSELQFLIAQLRENMLMKIQESGSRLSSDEKIGMIKGFEILPRYLHSNEHRAQEIELNEQENHKV